VSFFHLKYDGNTNALRAGRDGQVPRAAEGVKEWRLTGRYEATCC